MHRRLAWTLLVALMAAVVGCHSGPTAPSTDAATTSARLVGRFESEGQQSGQSTQSLRAPLRSGAASGIQVRVKGQPALVAVVTWFGNFELTDLPSGGFTLEFLRDGQSLGEISFDGVQGQQHITIVVLLTPGDEVVLIDEEREIEGTALSEGCPRGAGFWCQNQKGQNPNLTLAEFQAYAAAAATLLANVPELDRPAEVAAAVCNTRNQFVRQLATLALNLAAGIVTPGTALQNETAPYATVGAVFNAAVAHLTGAVPLSAADQETLKNVMDRINNAQTVVDCSEPQAEDPEEPEEEPEDDVPASGRITICHIPPGNYNARRTLTIGASAWPAHQRHCAQGICDSIGTCR